MTGIKHSIRYFGIAESDGSRIPNSKGMMSELWVAVCSCGWDSEAGVAHAKIVELVSAHKDVAAAAAAPAPVDFKALAKSVSLPVGSATALLAYAQDASNWGGQPWVNGNVNFGKATGGYIGKLVAAGLVELGNDGAETFLMFTPAGVVAAIALGAREGFNR